MARRALRDLLSIAAARALVSAACWWSGFRAISDDDYSRVVIAQRFAAAPSLDPSGTSWLPLPFWLYGIPMALFGDSLTTARAVALVLGVGSALLVWLAARLMGLSQRAALLGALAAVVLPYGAWLSCATVPEAPTAALILVGVVTLCRAETRLRLAGGVALGAACFCRYEAWAPALTFAVLCAVDAIRQRRRELWLAAAAAAGPIAAWLLHGVARHGDALFFVARVRHYRAALGGEERGLLGSALEVPWALLRFEPELLAVLLVVLVVSFRQRLRPFGDAAWRPLCALASLLVFLIAANLSGGAATHHPERSLLPVYWFLALLTAGLVTELAKQPRASLAPLFALPLALLLSWLLRPNVQSTFVNRHEEERIGSLLRHLGAQHVALDTPDFGFFAVQAALGYGRSWPLSEHDPRQPSPASPASSTELQARLSAKRADWLVLPLAKRDLAAPLGAPRATSESFAVFALGAPAPR